MNSRDESASYELHYNLIHRYVKDHSREELHSLQIAMHTHVTDRLIKPLFDTMNRYLTHTKHADRLRVFPPEKAIFTRVERRIEPNDKLNELVDGVMLLQVAGTGHHGLLFNAGREEVEAVIKAYDHLEGFTSLQRAKNFFAVYMAVRELLPALPSRGGFNHEPFNNLIANLQHILGINPQFKGQNYFIFVGKNELSDQHLHEVLAALVAATEAGGILAVVQEWDAVFKLEVERIKRKVETVLQDLAKECFYKHIDSEIGKGQYREFGKAAKILEKHKVELIADVEHCISSEADLLRLGDSGLIQRRKHRIEAKTAEIERITAEIASNASKLLARQQELSVLINERAKTNALAKRFLDLYSLDAKFEGSGEESLGALFKLMDGLPGEHPSEAFSEFRAAFCYEMESARDSLMLTEARRLYTKICQIMKLDETKSVVKKTKYVGFSGALTSVKQSHMASLEDSFSGTSEYDPESDSTDSASASGDDACPGSPMSLATVSSDRSEGRPAILFPERPMPVPVRLSYGCSAGISGALVISQPKARAGAGGAYSYH